MEAIRFKTTVGQGGSVIIPDAVVGEQVELIVLKLSPPTKPARKGGWAKGKIQILPGFDNPIPGMEEFV